MKSDEQEKVPKNFVEGSKGLARSICRVFCPSKGGKDGKNAASYFRNHKHYTCEFNYLQETFMPGFYKAFESCNRICELQYNFRR